MSISTDYSMLMVRNSIKTLAECLPRLNADQLAQVLDLIECQAPVVAAQLACKRAGEAQQGSLLDSSTLRLERHLGTCSFCGMDGQIVGACCYSCGEQV